MKIGRAIYGAYSKRKLGDTLRIRGTPRYDGTSTLLLANHQSALDYRMIAAACYRSVQQVPIVVLRDDVFHPDEKEDGRRLHPMESRKEMMRKHKAFYFVAKHYVGAVPVRRTDSAYPVGMHSPKDFLKELKKGEDILIFPTGKISRDGGVNFQVDYSDPLEDKQISRLLRSKFPIHVAFIHLTCDPVFGHYGLTFGDSYSKQDVSDLSFVEEMQKCTTITGLQLYHFMQRQEIDMSLTDAIIKLRKERYQFFPNVPPSDIEKKVDEFVKADQGSPMDYDLNGDRVLVSSSEFQSNAIMHLKEGLEAVLKA